MLVRFPRKKDEPAPVEVQSTIDMDSISNDALIAHLGEIGDMSIWSYTSRIGLAKKQWHVKVEVKRDGVEARIESGFKPTLREALIAVHKGLLGMFL